MRASDGLGTYIVGMIAISLRIETTREKKQGKTEGNLEEADR